MDDKLRQRLTKIETQIEVLGKAEALFFELEASEKAVYAAIYAKQVGPIEDKKNAAYASREWREFAKGLAVAHAEYNRERRIYELKLKAADSEYITYKIENQAIVRQK